MSSSTAAPPVPAPPPAPLSPAEALEFVEKQWLETHTFDEEEEMDTWDLKEGVFRKEPKERGRLVVVTGPMLENDEKEEDQKNLELIQSTILSKFGSVVSVSHRVMGSDSDNLFEVWLEAYEHELLFSRRSAVYDKDWKGGREVGDEWEGILDVIEDMVSDDSKLSYLV
ncbi:hypothetical protein TrRE_jg10164 [Triparma retinervis]|uniref:Uncharacterized protein n=1 Tax=Triparma retinervis TaxID=2557542 RepID=A0A9W7EDY3_9STRA|nr:hypothetical protein TrRE_jg10164 [Triparma retinervis]